MPDVKEIFDAMPGTFNKDAAAGVDAVMQYNITGDGGGEWHAIIKDQELQINEGTHDSPSMTMTIDAQDYIDMISGKLNGQMAFMTGKLKISGDMGLAQKMASLFKTD